jgi:hypothetical protein
MVRETAAWSLAHAHADDAGTREAIASAAMREVDPAVRRSILGWRDACR